MEKFLKIKKLIIVKYTILQGLDNFTEGIPTLLRQMVSSRFEEKNEKYFSVKKEIKYVRKNKKRKIEIYMVK